MTQGIMKRVCVRVTGVAAAAFCAALCAAIPASAQGDDKPGAMQSNQPAAGQDARKPGDEAPRDVTPKSGLDVEKLFANTCGWCHSNGGREAGKGPQLMGTSITDADIIYRVKNGKPGFMPAFSAQFNDAQLKDIVAYIRNLKPSK